MKVTFKDTPCIAVGAWYKTGDRAIILYEQDLNGEPDLSAPFATATVVLDEKPPRNCVYIKNYSENEGMSSALVRAGIILPEPKQRMILPFTAVLAYKLSDKAITMLWGYGSMPGELTATDKPFKPTKNERKD